MSTTAELSAPGQSAFQLKGSLFTLTVLRLLETDLTLFCQQLSTTVQKAPKFFQQTPVVIDLTAVSKRKDSIDFAGMAQQLKSQGLIPVGVCRGSNQQHEAAAKAGLGHLPEGKDKPASKSAAGAKAAATKTESPSLTSAAPAQEPASNKNVPSPTTPSVSKVITQPVRSGQQVYAKGGDLIVLASVSHGAELLADGHIHVYGTLRGRALAGINGYREARIFCHDLDAELVSVAGYYLLNDDQQSLLIKKNACVWLKDEQLVIDTL